ncbi:hypothetical protein JY651_49040 [Pyxidicoccus parkwayensis]|uniref:Lipoprotein n=1 Tax=Pyxidicoccus parkwayensis TaxID=2813578 RepID=A0ABX7NZP7_9BACT|nr:hypothetical protein [Pyxidicoccus parkwaysis]QSQ22957.1 hypothetical protein JY651_49040 [Pyxidicoccus parkwaysis]
MAFHARSWSPLLVAFAVVVIGGCRCGDPGLGGTREGFRPQEEWVEFGRVREGEQARRLVTLLATGRASITVGATAGAPFSVVTPEVTVPGSGTATVEVVFTAGNGDAEGSLVLVGSGDTETVRLTGTGVRPKPCPAEQCRLAFFDVESGECVDTPQPDGAACIPESRCEENGHCEAGACVGRPRSCDDDNPCTVDSCSPTLGCVTERVVCPAPSNPCKAGVCDREKGCKEVDVEDYAPCGALDCKNANVCIGGSCTKVPTPEGTVCAPATACRGEGTCQDGECELPDAGELEYVFRQQLSGAPVGGPGEPVLLVQDGALFTSVCGGDAGCRLVSYTAGGLLRFESPYPDGGVRTLLATSDAGVVVVGTEGLEGYAPRGDGARLWESSWTSMGPPSTVDAGTWHGETGAGRVALTAEGDVLAYVDWRLMVDAGDGGVVPLPSPEASRLVWLAGRADAGTLLRASPLEAWPGEARLALDVTGAAFLYSVDGRLARADVEEDGGTALGLSPLVDGGVPKGGASLAVAGDTLLVGARAFISLETVDGGTGAHAALSMDHTDAYGARWPEGTRMMATRVPRTDGGAPVMVDWDGGARTLVPLAEPALVSPEGAPGYLFARACGRTDGIACTPEEERVVLRAVNPETGNVAWEVDALPDEKLPGTLHDATLVEGDAVGVLAAAEQGDGPRVWYQLFAKGERLGMCPLPGRPHVAGAAFIGNRLHVIVERDGAWLLESYSVDGSAEPRGWPQRHGNMNGARRESP